MTKVTCSETRETVKWFHNVGVFPNPRKKGVIYWDLEKNSPITSYFQEANYSRQDQ